MVRIVGPITTHETLSKNENFSKCWTQFGRLARLIYLYNTMMDEWSPYNNRYRRLNVTAMSWPLCVISSVWSSLFSSSSPFYSCRRVGKQREPRKETVVSYRSCWTISTRKEKREREHFYFLCKRAQCWAMGLKRKKGRIFSYCNSFL